MEGELKNNRDRLEQLVHEGTRDLEEANEQLRRRVSELGVLNTIARETTRKLSLDQLAEAVFRVIDPALSPDLMLLFLHEEDRLVLRGLHTGNLEFSSEDVAVHRCGECLCGLAAAEMAPVFASDIHTDPRYTLHDCRKAGIRSFTALPLVRGDGLLGVLAMASTEKRDFSEQGDFLMALANEVAVGMHNVLLYVQEEQTHVLAVMLDITQRK